MRISVAEPLLAQEELDNVVDCVRTGWISSAGRYVDQFEQEWARICGAKHGVAVSNGTAALQIAVDSLGLKPGDEVILPTFTIISCANAVVRAGATPVLVDSEPRTWNMDVTQVESLITERTRAIMPVHTYGHPTDMDPLETLAQRHGLHLIEDAAEAHGAEYRSSRHDAGARWRRCGSFGDLAVFSFYSNKLITTGEGGMVVTDDDVLADKLRSLRNLCFRAPRRFSHAELGYNFRLTNLQAAIGVAQVKRLDQIVARKRAIAHSYSERLCEQTWLELPREEPWARSVFWVYGIVVRDEVPLDAEGLAARLAVEGIETRPFFLGMHEQPVFHRMGLFTADAGRFPVAERIARKGLYIPSGLGITEDQVDRVCTALENIGHEL